MIPLLLWSNRQHAVRLDLPKIRRLSVGGVASEHEEAGGKRGYQSAHPPQEFRGAQDRDAFVGIEGE